MARRTSDAGVEECKGYSPPNDHTTSASSTPLPLGSWDLNTATRPTVSEARMARNRARYAQRTERQRLHDAHQKRVARGASPAAGEYGSLSVINSAAQRLENKVLLIEASLLHSDWKTRFCWYSVHLFKSTCHVILSTNVFHTTCTFRRRGNTPSFATAPGKCQCSGGGGRIASYA